VLLAIKLVQMCVCVSVETLVSFERHLVLSVALHVLEVFVILKILQKIKEI
jgi:hypothetical protein